MDEELLLLRAKKERDKIFESYDKGRQSDNSIEPWEDPGFEVYHRTDKFVFNIFAQNFCLQFNELSLQFCFFFLQIRFHSRRTITTDFAAEQQCE